MLSWRRPSALDAPAHSVWSAIAAANDDAIMSNINYKLTMCARQPWVELDLSCDGESTPTE